MIIEFIYHELINHKYFEGVHQERLSKLHFVIDISILGCSNKCDHIRENQPVSEKKEVF